MSLPFRDPKAFSPNPQGPPKKETPEYEHVKHVGNHADVLKHAVLCSVITELQKKHPEGLVLAETHAGNGVYDLAASGQDEYKKGIFKVLRRHTSDEKIAEIPPAIRHYIQTLFKSVGSTSLDDFELYPGSPLLTQTLMRPGKDIQRLTDAFVDKVEGIDDPEVFAQMDCYEPKTLDFLMPLKYDGKKQMVILIDGVYKEEGEFGAVKQLVDRILERDPYATVLIWIPFIQNHRFRWSFATSLRDMAKEKAKIGRYYANIVVCREGLQGSGMLVINPTPEFDDVVDPKSLFFLAHVMNQGKDEYTVEQIMKKKKKGPLER